jgi:WD40 repeat protein
MQGSQNLFLIGYSNGLIRIFKSDDGAILFELSAHSRQVSGLACHPKGKSIFATVGDDSFMNLWEICG